MIADQRIGKSFAGALNYNLRKMYLPDPKTRAELLDTNFATMDSRLIWQEVKMVRSLRPNLGRYVYHTSLNFSNEDILDNKRILEIAREYLAESGYTNNQYMIFRHYDAEHPHIHLLVNRITFDGDVVSDSNNYKTSEEIVRKLERKYNLVSVEPSNKVSQKAITRNELEMIHRTGKPSDKTMLQELMNRLLSNKGMDMQEFIRRGEEAGIHFLFNQASTGRVTGITYFLNGFKVKGQALGNRYKWAEIIKMIAYEQTKHGQGISEANGRTTAKYGIQTATTGTINTATIGQRGSGGDVVSQNPANYSGQHRSIESGVEKDIRTGDENAIATGSDEERYREAAQDVDMVDDRFVDRDNGDLGKVNIEISDDIDDEAILGRNRHRKKMARTNRR